ncbi:MAG: tRNA (adenosine(37)-N6)-threonylcarbamoyltransferase complex ATPase subunit type 1 TsaE [Candidatus Absconditabacteria bacterium]
MEKSINNPQEMFDLGKSFSSQNSHILLNGELGAGKTTFTKGFVSGLGLDPDLVQSPTYTLVNIYGDKVLHIDMYRIDELNDLIEKGIIDLISNFEYVIIEWPKYIDYYDGYDWLNIQINKINYNTRTVYF